MKYVKKFVLILTLSSLILIVGACGSGNEEVLKKIEKELQIDGDVVYEEPMLDLKQDHKFTFDVKKGFKEAIKKNGINKRNIFSVYSDAKRTMELPVDYQLEDKEYRIFPTEMDISTTGNDGDVTGKGEWGHFEYYYLTQNVDLKTGEKLKKPIVTVFSVEQDLDTPQVSYKFDDENNLKFSWDKVDGAKEYVFIKVDYSRIEDAQSSAVYDTKKSSMSSKDLDDESIEQMMFQAYESSDDEQYRSDVTYWWDEESNVIDGKSVIGVMAVSNSKKSAIAYPKNIEKLAKDAVCEEAPLALEEQAYTEQLESVDQIPATIPVSACSGDTIYKEVILDEKNVKVDKDKLVVPYYTKNSTWNSEFMISSFDSSKYKKEITERKKAIGEEFKTLDSTTYFYNKPMNIQGDVKYSDRLPKIDDRIFSNSDLEEFITKNMIDGAHMINIAGFDDVNDVIYMADLLEEIKNQNPLILNSKNYYYNVLEKVIYVDYHYQNNVRFQQQQAIRENVTEVISRIITPEMNDVQKVYAINQYIVDLVTYHKESFDATVANDGYLLYQYFDGQNAKGALLDGLAVCEGYAHAFDLLAEEAGLDSIVVLGQIIGSETAGGHAWNRVNINDQWYVVDTTTNDSDDLPNSILNLSDEEANVLRLQDNRGMIDGEIDKYTANNNDAEYYRSIGNYVSIEEAANVYIARLAGARSVTLKMPSSADFEQCSDVFDQVYQRLGAGMGMVTLDGLMKITLH